MDKAINILNCVIIDDEPLAREVIHRFIERIPSLRAVAECSNAIQAMTVLQQNDVHLLFVDIQMPEILGTEFIKILKNPPKVIITTAYPQYALEGYELDVVDYLLKPIQFERFLKAINKVLQQTGIASQALPPAPEKQPVKNDPYLYFRTDRKMMKVMIADIIYIEGMKNYIKIVTGNGAIITKYSMAAAEAMLPEDLFIRVHRSYIVPKAKIRSFTSETIGIGNKEIPIGKLYRNEVLKSLSL
ncbi:MAG: LytTR family DNA-binding domain-containing protein [Bacteroidota bacterium]|nr:LytTR family DNA-binding domain-containing protein [Bacteroidota bacterium]